MWAAPWDAGGGEECGWDVAFIGEDVENSAGSLLADGGKQEHREVFQAERGEGMESGSRELADGI